MWGGLEQDKWDGKSTANMDPSRINTQLRTSYNYCRQLTKSMLPEFATALLCSWKRQSSE